MLNNFQSFMFMITTNCLTVKQDTYGFQSARLFTRVVLKSLLQTLSTELV